MAATCDKLVRYRPWARLAALMSLVFALASPGCTRWNLWGDHFPREVQEMTENVRPRDTETQPAGMSGKARDIEKSFGIGR